VYARRTILAAIIAATVCTMATAQAQLSIAFFDKRIYVAGVEIPVKVSIRNDTSKAWRFKLADEKRLSISVDVRTLGNRPLEASDSWKRAMASSSPAFYRELALQPGEEYSFVEDLRNFVSVSEPGTYVVSCTLWPELGSLSSSAPFIKSNSLTLSVRPGAPAAGATMAYRNGTAEILRAERIGPDEVVSRTIKARQKNLWNEFFLYLDLERLLRNNQDKQRAYDRESDDGRRRMLDTYKADLMRSVVDADIVVIPSSFEIIETRYGPLYGTVTVIQKFAYDGFNMIKEYAYELEKQDDIWYLVSYTVRNKGTE
jgi:hypothetical protein